MKNDKDFDFSGYATKNNLRCADGRTIMAGAFKEDDGLKVPLVWQHQHNDVGNVLGHAILENRADGVYAYGVFNNTPAGQTAKEAVKHGDVNALSIFANKLVQQGGNVLHGSIREVSLVLAGANPGAFIDNVSLTHSDGDAESEAIIYTGLYFDEDDFQHAAPAAEAETPAKTEQQSTNTETGDTKMAEDEKTVKDVFDSFTEEQKNVVYYLIGQALEDQNGSSSNEAEHSYDDDNYLTHDDINDGIIMPRNVFESFINGEETGAPQATLTHDQMSDIVNDAKRSGSFRESFISHAATYGIENIDLLFPDAKAISNTPDLISRRMEWVNSVLTKTRHTPFSRIKSVQADITADEARAKGYIKGNMKKEEVFTLLKRVTTPTTVYKKQKLDRDDIIDITDLDVVAFLRGEMRIMLDEELARAILVGDGRDVADADKIDETCIRPIWKDDDLYAHHVKLAADVANKDKVDEIMKARKEYKGSGNPVLYTTTDLLTDWMVARDTLGRRLHASKADLAAELGVSDIVEVEVLAGLHRTVGADTLNLVGIIVNLTDYTVGADKGGEINMFDDFDIDFNQQKYLIETRASGALTKPKSAIVIEQLVA